MRFVIGGIILLILSILVYCFYQTFPQLPEYRTLLAAGVVILSLGVYALVAVFRRSPYHRTAALIFFAAYFVLVLPVAQNSMIKHAMSFPALGLIVLAIDALIFWI